jgi:hypothetical protein
VRHGEADRHYWQTPVLFDGPQTGFGVPKKGSRSRTGASLAAETAAARGGPIGNRPQVGNPPYNGINNFGHAFWRAATGSLLHSGARHEIIPTTRLYDRIP